ncbi:NAD(P)-dependent oxidoreductase [Pseudomonas sp. BN414]|uniref:NAD(P)-dependent oxidoreductase n=1 Tax=Pseudomonas TaxID=286 RepID=UPI0015B7DAE7|nr:MULTISPECIES: NAD(P)-dependent oxidoreductase [Pseudomonas]MDH4561327.1 NAD(P)-dependent oxidoreductase [Pseudomonas sp. BN411]MDH4568259.1 NAD(P)-dependent oxidoreductase [Pseudomonas sp. BN414]MDH4580682.1 NAD(P)-dependent oxidoreductase [Pseudomonas sp. BN415]MDH4656981.1 NAD(P)-dependent oxidoreductase [Pseudomonas sp. BN606]NWL78004.1 oxidoreductase [Pseudomonas taiwanensis]
MSLPSIGFIGLGTMGEPMATRLVEAGYSLTVFDLNTSSVSRLVAMGATSAHSPAEVAAQAEIVLASLPTPDIMLKVALGENGVCNGGKVRVFIDLSTSGPRAAKQLASGLAAHDITALDCPVSGGAAGARKGTLALMVSGPEREQAETTPILKNLGKVISCGNEPGLGQTMKLVNNLVSVTALAVSCEALVMGVKAGLDAKVMLDVFNAGSGRNSATTDKLPRAILPRTFDFGFTTGLSLKDTRICLEEAEAMGVPMPVGSAVRQVLNMTRATYGEGADFTRIACLIEQWAGIEMPAIQVQDNA